MQTQTKNLQEMRNLYACSQLYYFVLKFWQPAFFWHALFTNRFKKASNSPILIPKLIVFVLYRHFFLILKPR